MLLPRSVSSLPDVAQRLGDKTQNSPRLLFMRRISFDAIFNELKLLYSNSFSIQDPLASKFLLKEVSFILKITRYLKF